MSFLKDVLIFYPAWQSFLYFGFLKRKEKSSKSKTKFIIFVECHYTKPRCGNILLK